MRKSDDINCITLYILTIYSGLFIYTSICRQFLLFGILDLRYLTLIVGLILIFIGVIRTIRLRKIILRKKNIFLLTYILLILMCNLMWSVNKIQQNGDGFKKLIILHLFNIVGFCVVSLFSKYISNQFLWKAILVACTVLVISMFLVYIGIPIESIWGTGRKGVNIISTNTNLTRNVLRQSIRVAGYAEDPNYATLFLFVGIMSSFQIQCLHKYHRVVITLIFICAIVIANSNTVFIALVVSAVVMVIALKVNKSDITIFLFIYLMIAALVFILPVLRIGNTLTTLSSRYDMWNNAFKLFRRNPILGNGLSSFRSIHSWYVHCHSTYWSILSESGIIAFFCWLSYLYLTVIEVKNSKIRYLLIFYSIYCMMFDMTYMQITVIIFCLIPEVYIHEQS